MRRVKPLYKTDVEPYASKVREANEMADRLLARYGEPTMSLIELRELVARQLPDIRLSDVIIEEREAGW